VWENPRWAKFKVTGAVTSDNVQSAGTKLAAAALDLLKLSGQKRLGAEQFEFKVTSLAEALIGALKKRVG
jgi:hypothetical protein